MLCGGWLAGKDCTEYTFDTHQWTRVPYSLTTERAEAAGAMLQNGSWMVIGGKGNDSAPMFSTEIFNNGFFTDDFLWPEAISGQCIESLNDSHLFIAGGESTGGQLLDTIYFLNVHSSVWNSLDKRLTNERRGHICGKILNNGKEFIIIAGGNKIDTTELLDLNTMQFINGPNLPFEMDWAASIKIGSSLIIVGGEHIGFCSKPGICSASNDLFMLDIENNIWKSYGMYLNLPRSKHIVLKIDNENIANDLCQDSCSDCKGEEKIRPIILFVILTQF